MNNTKLIQLLNEIEERLNLIIKGSYFRRSHAKYGLESLSEAKSLLQQEEVFGGKKLDMPQPVNLSKQQAGGYSLEQMNDCFIEARLNLKWTLDAPPKWSSFQEYIKTIELQVQYKEQANVIKSVCDCEAPMHKFGTADLDTCINCNKPIK